jgi:transposase
VTIYHLSASWLEHMLRLGVLKPGYIYPQHERAIRHLLVKRMRLVQHRTAQVLSLENLISRNTGRKLSWAKIQYVTDEQMDDVQFVVDKLVDA